MPNRKTGLCGALLVILVYSAAASAIPISGEVNMFGAFNTDTGDLATATSIDFIDAWTDGGTGSYAPINGVQRSVTFTDFTFSPSLDPGPVDPLWTFVYDGLTYSFVMTDISVVTQTSSLLELSGWGTLSITGFDDTEGGWEFVSGQDRGTFIKFTSAGGSVPEPGPLALLGLGLLGVALARRKASAQ